MVVLNACRSARTDALDPFGGLAQGLVQQDATAVVAMQFPISDRAAMAFTSDFYGSLVDGLPVDQAITMGALVALKLAGKQRWVFLGPDAAGWSRGVSARRVSGDGGSPRTPGRARR